MNTYNENLFYTGQFPSRYTTDRLKERGNFVSRCTNVVLNLLSLFLTPFYCLGLSLKWSLRCVLSMFSIVVRFITGNKFKHYNYTSDHDVDSSVDELTEEDLCTDQHKRIQRSPKLIACPNCEHLHLSSTYCDCRDCINATPRLLECFKYHKKEAQLLMCPCVDCTYRRPTATNCEHCVMVSEMVHMQAQTPEEIEIRVRPKRRK